MTGADVIGRLLDSSIFVPLLIAGSVVVVVVIKTIAAMVVGVQREKSRREIAAYIAEGSMSAEQGERLMKAGGAWDGGGENGRRSC